MYTEERKKKRGVKDQVGNYFLLNKKKTYVEVTLSQLKHTRTYIRVHYIVKAVLQTNDKNQ